MVVGRDLALALRFVLELAAFAAVAWWGFTLDAPTVVQVVIGVAAPLVLIVVWGALVSPRARFVVPRPVRLTAEVIVWLVATGSLLAVDAGRLAVTFAVLVVIDGAVLRATAGTRGHLEGPPE